MLTSSVVLFGLMSMPALRTALDAAAVGPPLKSPPSGVVDSRPARAASCGALALPKSCTETGTMVYHAPAEDLHHSSRDVDVNCVSASSLGPLPHLSCCTRRYHVGALLERSYDSTTWSVQYRQAGSHLWSRKVQTGAALSVVEHGWGRAWDCRASEVQHSAITMPSSRRTESSRVRPPRQRTRRRGVMASLTSLLMTAMLTSARGSPPLPAARNMSLSSAQWYACSLPS